MAQNNVQISESRKLKCSGIRENYSTRNIQNSHSRQLIHAKFNPGFFSLRIFFWNIITRAGLTTNLVEVSPSRIFTTTTQIKIKKGKY